MLDGALLRRLGTDLKTPFRRLLTWLEAVHETRMMRQKLAEFTQHELDDIGITRDQALREARRYPWDLPEYHERGFSSGWPWHPPRR